METVETSTKNPYIPIHCHSFWSLLDSTVDIKRLCKSAHDFGLPAIILTDHHNIKGVVTFVNEAKKNDIKPIIGCELNVLNPQTSNIERVTVVCKNKQGYKNLLKILAISNTKTNIINNKPTVNINDLLVRRGGLILMIGDIMSPITMAAWGSWDNFKANNITINPVDNVIAAIKPYLAFEHVFLFTDLDSGYKQLIQLNDIIIQVGKRLNLEVLPSNNIHYLNKTDKEIHRLILKSNTFITTPELDDYEDYVIFNAPNPQYHLLPEIKDGHKTLQILDLIEDFSIKERPILPQYKTNTKENIDANELLRNICRQGFKDKLMSEVQHNKQLFEIYTQRAKYELELFKSIGLSSYFLIVKDIIDYCKSMGLLADIRGSSTGCLINYLIGVSSVDPIMPDPTVGYSPENELQLSRFYNHGRNTKDHISLPDIDIDIPPSFRKDVIDFLRDKYGHDNVGHIITHQRFKGKGAIKEVFRLLNYPNYFEISNEITKVMIDESKISDELAELQEEDPDYGIIQWNIDHISKIKNYYDEYTTAFDMAIELEKIPKHAGIHAAGIIITNEPLGNLFPVAYSSKLDDIVVAIEGKEVEELGALKLDILGLAALEKVYKIQNMVNFKETETYVGI